MLVGPMVTLLSLGRWRPITSTRDWQGERKGRSETGRTFETVVSVSFFGSKKKRRGLILACDMDS